MSESGIKTIGTFMAVVGVLGIPIVWGVSWQSNGGEVTCTVESKDRTTNRNGGSDARVYTDCGVFAVADDLFRGHFASADVYAQIEPGEMTFDTVGWRFPFMSTFPNIIEVK